MYEAESILVPEPPHDSNGPRFGWYPNQDNQSSFPGFFFFFLPHYASCRILVPRPRIEPTPLAVEAQGLSAGSAGKSLSGFFLLELAGPPFPFWSCLERYKPSLQFGSVTQSCLTLWPHRLQHARPPCPSPTPRVYSDSCPSSRWCHLTISSSVVPFSSHLQSFPASGSFQMSQFFTSDDQSIGVSASASVLPVNIQDWFPLGWTG